MKTLGYYNGEIAELDELKIPFMDRAGYFGDGVYDATYSRNHIIYNLDAHVDRFYRSAELLRMTVPMDKEACKDLLRELVKKVDDGEQFVYWQITRGTGPRNHVFPAGDANFWVMLRPNKIRDLRTPVRAITVEDDRFLLCHIKTINLLPAVMASQKALEAGCEEAIFHRGDRVTECAHSNVSILKNGTFITAPLDNLILPGTARRKILTMCDRLGIPTEERPYTLSELFDADEIIITSAGTFCLPLCELDGRPVGGKDPKNLEALKQLLLEDFVTETGGGSFSFD